MSKENNNGGSSDLTDVGSFWKKKGKNGNSFLAGEVRIGDATFKAFIFPNKKAKDTHPDYRLSLADLPEDMVPPAFGSSKGKPAQSGGKAKAAPSNEGAGSDVPEDDIPF